MMGNGRQSQAGGADSKEMHDYKKSRAARKADSHLPSEQPLGTFSSKRVTSLTIGTMVSMWFLAKVFVTFAPLTSVVAQYSNASVLPGLLDATADELVAGLEAGQFTSLDLVQVSMFLRGVLSATHQCTTGLRETHSRSQFHFAHGHRNQPGCLVHRN